MKNSYKRKEILGVVSCFLLAALCLAGGISQTAKLRVLLNEGKRVEAQVFGIKSGAKGLKTAILQFAMDTGDVVTATDMFPIMMVRFKKGEYVTALYNPLDVKHVTVDIGLWMWQQPIIL